MMVRDRGVGRVWELLGQHYIRYRFHPDDARDMGAGILMLAEAFFAAGAQRVLLPCVGIPNEPVNPQSLSPGNFRPRDLVVSGFHPQGTAAMGSVVDSDLRLVGSRRISVCDASVFPDSPGVNPMVTIMALSLRLADRLASEISRS